MSFGRYISERGLFHNVRGHLHSDSDGVRLLVLIQRVQAQGAAAAGDGGVQEVLGNVSEFPFNE